MSNALDFLRQSMFQHNAAISFGDVFNPKPLDKEIAALQKSFAKGPAKPTDDLVIRALRDFYNTSSLETYRQARLVSCGFTSAWGPDAYCLIEDSARFPKMLDGLEPYRETPRAYRRCYKGLLDGYFSYDPAAKHSKAPGRKNWELLRTHLDDGLQFVRAPGIEPDWVGVIDTHSNLLRDNPCLRYSQAMLDGRDGEFELIKSKLDISDSSWLTRQLVLAQVQTAIDMSDAGFIKYLSSVLDLLEKHGLLINEALPKLLTRYSKCKPVTLNPELRDFSVACWGNPVLASNEVRWSLVADGVRDMVGDWLKLYLIHQFFSLLAQDGQNDTRRLKFWQRYYKHLDGVHFALGQTAFTSARADFRKLREQARGQILNLVSAGGPDNNAFIMSFKKHVVVEFGMHGNACFVFEKGSLPFKLSGYVSGDSNELKHQSREWRGRHADTNAFGTWENQFEYELAPILGCRPGSLNDLPIGVGVQTSRRNVQIPSDEPLKAKQFTNAMQRSPAFAIDTTEDPPPAVPSPAVAQPASIQPKAQERVQPSAQEDDLYSWCQNRGFGIKDLREKGGNLLIETGTSVMEVNRVLRGLGFKYKDGKGWWRKW